MREAAPGGRARTVQASELVVFACLHAQQRSVGGLKVCELVLGLQSEARLCEGAELRLWFTTVHAAFVWHASQTAPYTGGTPGLTLQMDGSSPHLQVLLIASHAAEVVTE